MCVCRHRQVFVAGENSCYSRVVAQLTGKMPARLKAAYISLVRKVLRGGPSSQDVGPTSSLAAALQLVFISFVWFRTTGV